MENEDQELPDLCWVTFYRHDGQAHVIPHNDSRLHDADTLCPCCPEVDEDDGLVTHNSFDGREAYEEGHRKFN
jgi:hypothetical protein